MAEQLGDGRTAMGHVRLRLSELAQAQGMNMSQVQRQSGLTLGMIRRYWLNRTTTVSLPALGVLAELLHVQPGDLLTDDRETANHS